MFFIDSATTNTTFMMRRMLLCSTDLLVVKEGEVTTTRFLVGRSLCPSVGKDRHNATVTGRTSTIYCLFTSTIRLRRTKGRHIIKRHYRDARIRYTTKDLYNDILSMANTMTRAATRRLHLERTTRLLQNEGRRGFVTSNARQFTTTPNGIFRNNTSNQGTLTLESRGNSRRFP